ncbi:DUF4979 domain-containing protein [Thalassobellus sediminis]|uniref:DUF4979 domain-containing protein n=1 Tax=Thalassobellus sediminis TaxID=3367753 RepID=UPI0037B08828
MKKNRIITNIFTLLAFGFITFFVGCVDNDELSVYQYPEPIITDFSPTSGQPGQKITINGTDFGTFNKAVTVFFGEVATNAEEIVSLTNNQIVVRVPSGVSAGETPITVKVWTYNKLTETNFNVLPGAKANSLSVSEGNAGDQISIIGENFGNDPNALTIEFAGGITADIISINDSEIVVTVPEGGQTGAVNILFDDIVITGPVFTYPFVGLDFQFNTDNDAEGWIINSQGNGSFEVSGGQYNVTFDQTQSKRRADFRLDGGADVHAGKFPIIAIKINKPSSGNFILDTNLGKYKNGSNNWDGVLQGDIYYYDIRNTFGSGAELSQTEGTSLTTFQWKIADITTDEVGYSVDWVRSFESLEKLMEYTVLPYGKFIYEFDDPNATDYWVGQQNATNVVEDSKLKVTFEALQFDGTKRRSDLKFIEDGIFPEGSPTGKWHYSTEFPILAFKLAFTGTGAPVPGSGNIKLDRFNGAQNNAYLTDFVDDNVIYYDCSIDGGFTQDGDLASFQLKIADITSTEETGYEVFWISSFRNVDELAAYIATH